MIKAKGLSMSGFSSNSCDILSNSGPKNDSISSANGPLFINELDSSRASMLSDEGTTEFPTTEAKLAWLVLAVWVTEEGVKDDDDDDDDGGGALFDTGCVEPGTELRGEDGDR